ncbi:MAG: hypothetical protein J6Q38_00185 [Clostridia bacterium]|nr:hypothetical protein [Clostridia bacterium]
MKKFKLLTLIIALITALSFSIGCLNTGDGSVTEVPLNEEEVQKVTEVSEVLGVVSEVEIPDLSEAFGSSPILPFSTSGGSNFTGLNSDKYTSLTMDFKIATTSTQKYTFPDSFKAQPDFALIGNLLSNVSVTSTLTGSVKITEEALTIEYSSVSSVVEMGSAKTTMNTPLKIYIDENSQYVCYGGFDYTIKIEEETTDVGVIVEEYLGDLLGKWIDLGSTFSNSALNSSFKEVFNSCVKALTEEIDFYSDYLSENIDKKFVKKGGKYLLKSENFEEFTKSFIDRNEENTDNNLLETLFGDDFSYSYSGLSGSIEYDISNMNEPKISFNNAITANASVSDNGETLGVTVTNNVSGYYNFKNINSTTITKPTEVFDWPR